MQKRTKNDTFLNQSLLTFTKPKPVHFTQQPYMESNFALQPASLNTDQIGRNCFASFHAVDNISSFSSSNVTFKGNEGSGSF